MSKYNQDSLKRMSEVLVQAKEANDVRYTAFMAFLSLRAGVSEAYIEDRIQEYLLWEPEE